VALKEARDRRDRARENLARRRSRRIRKAQKELRKAEWAEFDLDRAEWNIAAIPMKTREPHLVPLSRQAVECLRELYPLTGWGRHVFPGVRSASRPLSENTVNAALRRLGYAKTDMTGHGFRAMAGTILDEVLGVSGATLSSTSLPTPCATPLDGPTTAPRT